MNINLSVKSLKPIILTSVGLTLFISAFGLETATLSLFGVLVGVLLIVIIFLSQSKISLPKGFFIYILFLTASALSVIWSYDKEVSFVNLALYVTGGILWILFYNLKGIGNLLGYAEIILGYALAAFFVISVYSGVIYISALSLTMPSVETFQHHHLGDFWVIVLLTAFGFLTKEKRNLVKWILVITLIFGFYLLSISYSRSAYLALFVGGIYMAGDSLKKVRNIKIYALAGTSVVILFLLTGGLKTTLFSRGYFFQSAAGFLANPLGVGVGNFSFISGNSAFWVFGFKGVSDFTHNILLEILVGIGIFSILFYLWLFQVGKDVFSKKEDIDASNTDKAVFLAIFVNFLFDYTYFIPTMLWLWFIHLGLVQQKR